MITKDFLMMSTAGESVMMDDLSFLVELDVYTNERRWCIASQDHCFTPFGKLVKLKGRKHSSGRIIDHQKNYHGFFGNLRCTEDFYNKYKEVLDKYITEEKYLMDAPRPTWF